MSRQRYSEAYQYFKKYVRGKEPTAEPSDLLKAKLQMCNAMSALGQTRERGDPDLQVDPPLKCIRGGE